MGVWLPNTCGELLRQTVINLFVDLATKLKDSRNGCMGYKAHSSERV